MKKMTANQAIQHKESMKVPGAYFAQVAMVFV